MSLKRFHHFVFTVLIILSASSCSDAVVNPPDDPPYVSLQTGDERQFVLTTDSSTLLYRITGTTKRSDSTLVFRSEWVYGTDTAVNVSYYFIRDGYFIATDLDTTEQGHSAVPGNPFREQKLAKLYPANGDRWKSINGDTSSIYFTASFTDSTQTFAGRFSNCVCYSAGDILKIYYAKGVGHIASHFNQGEGKYLASYIKTGGKVIGSKFPAKSPAGSKPLFTPSKRKLGESLLLGAM